MKRGDVLVAWFPHSSGGQKKRPVVVVQSDHYNQRMRNVVVAEITSTLKRAHDAAHVFVDISTPEGQPSGLVRNSAISCLNLATIRQDRVARVIGQLSATLLQQVDASLKIALSLP